MPNVELPNGKILEFPEGTSEDTMRTAIQRNFPEYAPQKQQPQHQDKPGVMASIGQDIKGSLYKLPGEAIEMIKELPGEFADSAKLAFHDLTRASSDVISGSLEGLKGLYNLPVDVTEYLGRKGVPGAEKLGKILEHVRIGDTGLRKFFFGEDQPGDALLRGIGQFNPAMRATSFVRRLSPALQRATAAGVVSAGQGQDPLQAALMGLAGEKAVRGAQRIRPRALSPSSMLKSEMSPEELKRALEVTRGTETGLGDVIDSPYLKKKLENQLTAIPFTGANEAMLRTARTVTGKGEDLLNKIKGTASAENIGFKLSEALKEAESEVQAKKRQNYEKVNKAADDAGIVVRRNNISSVAQEHLEDINKSPELARGVSKELLEDLKFLSNRDSSNNFKLSDIFRGTLGEKASKAFESGDRYQYRIYRSLKDAISKDIDSAVEESSNKNIIKEHKYARKYYKDHVVPFEDPDIMKFTRGGADPDTLLNTFLKVSRVSDRSNILNKLLTKLSPEDQKLVPYAYYSRAIDEGKLNPLKMRTLHKSLGPEQRKTLLSDPDLMKAMDDYSELVGKNTEPLSIMINPKSGARNPVGISSLLSSLLAAGGTFASGNPFLGLGMAAAPSVAGRLAVKGLTSPKARERLVEKMIKEKTSPRKARRDYGLPTQVLISALQNQNNQGG